MKRKMFLVAGLAATLVSAAAMPAFSHGIGGNNMGPGAGAMMDTDGDQGAGGYGFMAGQRMGAGGMMGGQGWTGPTGVMGNGSWGNGPMGGGMMGNGMMGGGMMGQMMTTYGAGFGPMPGPGFMGTMVQKFDTNGDGVVSPDELRNGLQGDLKKYDANGDGTLSLDEFATFYADITRTAMVRHFQAFDADGDGKITASEFTAPADRMGQMQKFWQSHQWGGMTGPGAGPKQDDK